MFSPVGSWLARVERPSGTTEVAVHFTAEGLAFLTAGGHGAGSWGVEADSIVYGFREPMVGHNGDYLGYIDISQRGTVIAGQLSSSGESRVYGVDGALMRTVPVRINAVPRSPEAR